jgi:hypothetical protein
MRETATLTIISTEAAAPTSASSTRGTAATAAPIPWSARTDGQCRSSSTTSSALRRRELPTSAFGSRRTPSGSRWPTWTAAVTPLVSLQAVYDYWHGGPLPRKPVVLSFDDGFETDYSRALPILGAHGWAGDVEPRPQPLHAGRLGAEPSADRRAHSGRLGARLPLEDPRVAAGDRQTRALARGRRPEAVPQNDLPRPGELLRLPLGGLRRPGHCCSPGRPPTWGR